MVTALLVGIFGIAAIVEFNKGEYLPCVIGLVIIGLVIVLGGA